MKRMHVHRGSAVPNPFSQVDFDKGEEIKRSENGIKMSICYTPSPSSHLVTPNGCGSRLAFDKVKFHNCFPINPLAYLDKFTNSAILPKWYKSQTPGLSCIYIKGLHISNHTLGRKQ